MSVLDRIPLRRVVLAIALVLAGLLADGSTASAAHSKTFTLRLADNTVAGTPGEFSLQVFFQNVASLTGGHVRITEYSGGVLGNEASELTQLQLGTLDSSMISTSAITSQLPVLGLFSLPGLFPSDQAVKRLIYNKGTKAVYTPVWNAISKKVTPDGVVPITIFSEGPSVLIADRPVASASDMKGLKLRTLTDTVSTAFFGLTGAIVVPLPYPQVYTALQQHLVDGAVAGAAAMQTSSFYQVAKYLSQIDQQYQLDLLFFSKKTWSRLPVAYQAAIRTAAQRATIYDWKIADHNTAKAIAQMAAEGVTVTPNVDVRSFSAASATVRTQFASAVGASILAAAEKLLGI